MNKYVLDNIEYSEGKNRIYLRLDNSKFVSSINRKNIF
jgi:hypothetical protein